MSAGPALANAPTLAELQAVMQAAIIAGDPAPVNEHLRHGAHTNRETLFGVYAHAYVARLVGVLRSDYPLLAAYVGGEAFDQIARGYVAANPSRHQNARWFGAAFADHLASDDAPAHHGVCAELARLEWSLGLAFDAENASALTLGDMALIQTGDWPDLEFTMQPSARLFRETWNAFEIWSALKEETPPPPATRHPEPRDYLVWRHGVTPRIRGLPPEEAMLWLEAARGVTFGRLCELAALFDDPPGAPVRVAGILRGWLETGVLGSARVTSMAV